MTELEGVMELEQLVEEMTFASDISVPESNVRFYKELQGLLKEYPSIAKNTNETTNKCKYNNNNDNFRLKDTSASSKVGEVVNSSEDVIARKAIESKSNSTAKSNEKNDEEESNEYFNNNKEILQQRLRHNRSKRERQYDSLHLSRKKCNIKNNSERTNNDVDDDTLNEETNAIDILACIQPLNTDDNIKRSAENVSSSSSSSCSSLELECEQNSEQNDGNNDNKKAQKDKNLTPECNACRKSTLGENYCKHENTKRKSNTRKSKSIVDKSKTKTTNKSKITSDEHDKEEIVEQDIHSNHIQNCKEEQEQSPEDEKSRTRHTNGDQRDSNNIDHHRDNIMMMKKQQQKGNIRKNYKSTRASHSPSPRCTPAQYWDITFPASLDRKSSSNSENSFSSTTPEHK